MKKIKIGDCFEGDPDCRPLICTDPNYADGYIGVMDRDGEEFAMNEDICDSIPTLHLPIGNSAKYGGAWFDLIRTGEKKEEYRDIWGENETGRNIPIFVNMPAKIAIACYGEIDDDPKFLDFLRFHMKELQPKVLHLTNGYGHNRPQLWAHIEGISIGRGNPEWGAPTDRDVFIIRLGEVFHTKNLKA